MILNLTENIQAIANKLGFDWNYKHPSEIMDEIARLTPLYAGVSYDRLEGFNSLQWLCIQMVQMNQYFI